MGISFSKAVWGLVGVVFVAATVWLTSSVLNLLPATSGASRPEEEVGFLAHLLMPLSVALFLVVIVTILGAALRVALAFWRPASREDEPRKDGSS